MAERLSFLIRIARLKAPSPNNVRMLSLLVEFDIFVIRPGVASGYLPSHPSNS